MFTNNGATYNSTLAVTDDADGGALGGGLAASASVDVYTSISIAQTTAGQTITLPTPTSSTNYGRILYISNVGTVSFILSGATMSAGTSATLVWSNTNGGASWQYAGADANGILNQNTADQTANFRISGTGRANTSFITPAVDSISGALSIGGTTATGLTLGNTTNTSTITLQGTTGAAYGIGANATTGTISLGGSTTTGAITIGQYNSTGTSTINIGAALASAGTQTINIGTGSTGTGNLTLGNTGGGFTTIQSPTINLNAATVVTNATNLSFLNTNAATVTAFQAATSLGIGATTGTFTVRNANQTFGNAAGSGVFTNNGSTLNATLALGDDNNGGVLGGTAAATVDIYTSISIAQTTASQTFTIATPTASTNYGRLLYISNIGTTSFTLGTATISAGTTATMVWSNTNGGASWQFAGADANGILNQNSFTQTGNFRISGTGQVAGIDALSGAGLALGATNATSLTLGNTTNTTSILLQGAAAAVYTIGTSNNTGGITIGNSTANNTISIGGAAGASATQTINIGTSATASSVTNLTLGSLIGASANAFQSGSGGSRFQVGTDGSTAFRVQNSIAADGLTYDSTQTSNVTANGGAETSGTFSTNWTAQGTTTVNRDTSPSTDIASGTASVEAILGTTSGNGVINNLASNPAVSSTYVVSFTIRQDSGTAFTPNTNLNVRYTPNGGTNNVDCTNYSSTAALSASWIKLSCVIATAATAVSNPDLIIRQSDTPGSGRTIHVDNISMTLQSSSSVAPSIKIGGSLGQGLTLFTLDNFAAAPWSGTTNTAFGSMYYDTTIGKIQCYQANGWGSCGVPANQIVTLTPEFPGAVLNGGSTPGVGTMTADFCANGGGLTVNTTLCASGEARNYYKWTSPQASQQIYSIYVTYKLPSNFSNFLDNNTIQLTGRTDSTTNGFVTYELFRSTGGAISACGTETTVTSSVNTWQPVSNNGNETSCSYAGGDYVIFKINVKAEDNANVYVENLNFTFTTI